MTETETNYQAAFKSTHYPSKWELHNTFGGIISASDYNTEYNTTTDSNSSHIANRIATAKRFDDQCKRNAESRERTKK